MKFVRFGLIFLLVSVFQTVLAYAQENNTLSYGDRVEGEITNRNFEIEYLFNGEAGDIIVIELIPEDRMNGLAQPSVILLDAEGDVLEVVNAGIATATMFFELPYSGEYSVLATRRDGRSGDSVGKYTLALSRLEVLVPGDDVQSTVTSESVNYFAVKTSASFDIVYQRGEGTFYPEIVIGVLSSDGFGDSNLSVVASAEGDALTRASIGVDVSGEQAFIVAVREPLFQFNFREVTVNYTLRMRIAE